MRAAPSAPAGWMETLHLSDKTARNIRQIVLLIGAGAAGLVAAKMAEPYMGPRKPPSDAAISIPIPTPPWQKIFTPQESHDHSFRF